MSKKCNKNSSERSERVFFTFLDGTSSLENTSKLKKSLVTFFAVLYTVLMKYFVDTLNLLPLLPQRVEFAKKCKKNLLAPRIEPVTL